MHRRCSARHRSFVLLAARAAGLKPTARPGSAAAPEVQFGAKCAVSGAPRSCSHGSMSSLVPTALVILHGLVAVALLGAITHQALASWAPARIVGATIF